MTADGKLLVYNKSHYHQDVYVGELGQRPVSLRTPRRFTLDNHDNYPAWWTSDSRDFLFMSNRNGRAELFRQGLNDTVPERIVASQNGAVLGAAMTPEGSWLLYSQEQRAPDGGQIVRFVREPAGGGSPEAIGQIPKWESLDWDCARSTKAAHPCMLGFLNGNTLELYTLDPLRGKGDQLGTLAVDSQTPVGFAISPDASQIAVVDNRHLDKIEILKTAQRSWREIPVEPGHGKYQSIAWAADGQGFFVTTWLPQSLNLIYVALSGKVKILASNAHTQWFSNPNPSPDGKYLAFQAQSWDNNVAMLRLKF